MLADGIEPIKDDVKAILDDVGPMIGILIGVQIAKGRHSDLL